MIVNPAVVGKGQLANLLIMAWGEDENPGYGVDIGKSMRDTAELLLRRATTRHGRTALGRQNYAFSLACTTQVK